MASSVELEGDGASLQELFSRGMETQKKLENDEVDRRSVDGRKKLMEGMKCLEQATQLVNQLSLFSKNEDLEDVTTSNLKFFLLPALLGDLTMNGVEGDDRLENIQKARVYFIDYLQRSKSYSITTEDVPGGAEGGPASMTTELPSPRANYEKMAAERTAKIQRYKRQKELEKKLKELTAVLDATPTSKDKQADEESSREHILTLLKLWSLRCSDNISFIDREVPMLQEMEKRRESAGGRGSQEADSATAAAEADSQSKPKQKAPWKPIVITREMLQSQVYGAGYPSLPTMTVEQFYEQKYKEQMEARPQGAEMERKMRDLSLVGGHGEDQDGGTKEEEEEEEEDSDSEEALKKARERDEFKDDNRRGWGNKKNMG